MKTNNYYRPILTAVVLTALAAQSNLNALGANTVIAWGSNGSGQTNIPPDLTNAIAIAAGSCASHTLALRADGTVVAWGNNSFGQTNVPSSLSNVMAVAVGLNHSLALKADGTVAAWGNNSYGQLNVPINLTNAVAIAAGGYHNLALKRDKTVICWGANSSGQCAIPPGLTNVVAVAGGNQFSMALKDDGTVVAWGDNSSSQTNVPANLTNAVAIAAGWIHGLALKADGTVVGWGENGSGQTSIPVGLTNVTGIAAGGFHSLALKRDKTVICWGANSSGQTNVPTGLTNLVAIAGGAYHSLALVQNPASPPTIPPTISALFSTGAGLTLSFASQPGYTYDIEYKNSLTDPSWNALLSVVATTALTTIWDSPLQHGSRFYRISCRGIIPEPATAFEPPTPPLTSPGAPTCGAAQDDSLAYLFSGEFHYTVKDLVIKSRGMDFVWARTYRSKVGQDTTLGKGWSCSYDIRVVPNGTDFDVYDGTGRKDTYRLQPNGTYVANQLFCEGTYSNLVFTLKFPDTGTWEFTPLDGSPSQGKLNRRTDRNGNTEHLHYDMLGVLMKLVDTQGRTNTVSYNADGLVSAVTDFAGRQITYTYYQNGDAGGAFGDLKSVTSPAVTNTPNGNDFPAGKTVTYTYTKGFADPRLNHNLLTITDAKGQTWLRNTYAATTNSADYNFDRLLSQARGNSNDVLTFCYRPQSPASAKGFAITKAIVNDRVGNVSEHLFDATNRLVHLRQFTGRAVPGATTTETQNRPTAKLRASDPDFFENRYSWNADSLVASIVYANSNNVQNTYEADLNPSASRRSCGNLRVRRQLPGLLGGDQLEIIETFAYDTNFCGAGFVTQATDGRTNTTYHAYDSHGNRTNTIHAVSSAVEDFAYNAYGQMTAHILPDNGSGHRRRDEMAYYTNGTQTGYLEKRVVDADGFALTTRYEHDAVGNPVRVVDPRGADTLYTYNALDQVVRDFSGAVSTSNGPVRYSRDLCYDANNNLIRVDALNVDENGMLVATNSCWTTLYFPEILNYTPNYTVSIYREVDPFHSIVTEYTYNSNRQCILIRSGEAMNGNQPNNVASYIYDEYGRLFETIRAPGDPGQSTTMFCYDTHYGSLYTAGILQGIEDGIPRETAVEIDDYARRVIQYDSMDNSTYTYFDANGKAIGRKVLGALRRDTPGYEESCLADEWYNYDAMNRLVKIDRFCFDPATGDDIGSGHAISRLVYNDNSQVTQSIDANNHTTTMAYDTANRPSIITDAMGNTTTYTYDNNSNVVEVTEVELSDLGSPAQTFHTTYVYDELNRLVQTTDNLGNTSRFAYDSRNNLVTLTDPRGNVTRYSYDGINRLTATTRVLTDTGDGNGTQTGTIVTRQTWDDNSRLTSQTDAHGNTTTYLYDSLNRMTGTVFADGTINSISYDVHDNPIVFTDANGNVVNANYDLLNRVTAKSISRGPYIQGTTSEGFTYDGLSRITTATNNDSVAALYYDSLSHVVKEVQSEPGMMGWAIENVYDGVGNLSSRSYPGGRVVNCDYDALDRRAAVYDSLGPIASYNYFGPARVERRDYGNGTRADYTYDGLRRMTNSHQKVIWSGIPIDSRSYTWDAAGNQTAVNDLLTWPRPTPEAKSFTYDSANRLVASQTAVTGPTISYSLDGVGNRVNVTGGANAGSYFLNPAVPPADFQANQYTTTPFDTRAYDANGNLIHRGPQLFVYDYQNQLLSAWHDNGEGISTNTMMAKYDCFGRRIEKASAAGVSHFYYAGSQEIEEQNGEGETVATYVWGNGIDDLISSDSTLDRFYYHADDMFSIRKVTGSAGGVWEQYRYGDYGEPSFFDVEGNPLSGTQIANSTLFTGRRYDPETGLYYYRTRYLDPTAGRFTTRDTLGIWTDQMNAGNGYTYVGNNSYSVIDPFGTDGDLKSELTDLLRGEATDQAVESYLIYRGLSTVMAGDIVLGMNIVGLVFDPVEMGRDDFNWLRQQERTRQYRQWLEETSCQAQLYRYLHNQPLSWVDQGLADIFEANHKATQSKEQPGAWTVDLPEIIIVGHRDEASDTGWGFSWGDNTVTYIDPYPSDYFWQAGYNYVDINSASTRGGWGAGGTYGLVGSGSWGGNGTMDPFWSDPEIWGGFDLGFITFMGDANKWWRQWQMSFGANIPTHFPRHCFLAGTDVSVPCGFKPIEEVVVGDWVLSGSEEEGQVERAQVVSIHSAFATNCVCIGVEDEQIWCTGEHPFWVVGKGWVPAKQLERGSILTTEDRASLPVAGVTFVSTNVPTTVYNLTVGGSHTYFVGKSRILVHNKY